MSVLTGGSVKAEIATVTSKGQVVIPSKLRHKFGIRKGTQVAFIEDGERLWLQPLTPEYIRGLRGALKGEPTAMKFLIEERKKGET